MWLKSKFVGSSLIEVLVVVTILSFVLIAMLNAAMVAIIQTKFARSQTLANRYSQQAIDWIRSTRDNQSKWDDFVQTVFGTDWNNVNNKDSTVYCLTNLSLTIARACGNTDFVVNTKFIRQADFMAIKGEPGDSGQIQVTVITKWRDGLCANASQTFCHQAKIVTYLSQWNLN